MRLERALLLEKLEEKTPAHVDDSEGSESEMSSVDLLHQRIVLTCGTDRTRETYTCSTIRITQTQ